MEKISLMIVDDQNLFRQSLGSLISSEPEFDLAGGFDSGESILNWLHNAETLPELVIADMEMPGMNGLELCEVIHKKHPLIKIIILSVHAGERIIARMIEAGASGYLVKNCNSAELFTAIRSVHHTGFYINQQVLQAIQRTSVLKNKSFFDLSKTEIILSPREQQVLELICMELNTAEIAAKLFISARTAEGHRNNLLLKTGCRNVAGLVVFAVKSGIFDPRNPF